MSEIELTLSGRPGTLLQLKQCGGGMSEIELTLSAHNRVAFRRTLAGALYCELLRPGELRDGHGWIVCDSAFLEPEDIARLRELLSGPADREAGRRNSQDGFFAE